MFKNVLIGLVGLSLTAALGTEASAKVCGTWLGGTCIYYSGSVECNLSANGVGNIVTETKYLGCMTTSSGEGLLLCGNPGKNNHTAPGIQIVSVPASFGATTAIQEQNIDEHGIARVTVSALPDLAALNELCPNKKWVALDYVPCDATIDAQLTDDIGTISSATFSCTLPSCETLGYDATTNKFERRQYDCAQQ